MVICCGQNLNFASAGNRNRVNCLECSYAHHYTTDTHVSDHFDFFGKYFTSISFRVCFPLSGLSHLWTFMNCSQISLMVSKLSIVGRVFNMSSKTSSTLTWLDCLSNDGYHSLRWIRVSKGTSTGVITSWDETEFNHDNYNFLKCDCCINCCILL